MRTARRGVTAADEARDVLATVVLSHVPVPSFNFRLKSIYIAYMVGGGGRERRGVGEWGKGNQMFVSLPNGVAHTRLIPAPVCSLYYPS